MFFNLIGLLFGLLLPAFLPDFLSLQALFVMAAVVLLYAKLHVFRLLLCLLLGVTFSTWNMGRVVDAQIDESLTGKDLEVSLTILIVETRTDDNLVRFVGVLNHLKIQEDVPGGCPACDKMHGQRIQLAWRDKKGDAITLSEGDDIHGVARLKRPRGFVNPGGFDYQAWLLHRRISATGYLKSVATLKKGESRFSYVSFVQRIRANLHAKFFDNGKHIALTQALLLGDTSNVSPEQWRILQSTGTIHLIAISGLHVGLIAGLVFSACRLFIGFLPSVYFGMDSRACVLRSIPVFASVFAAGVYVLISGSGIPAQRAWWVVLCIGGFHILGRKINPFNALLLVAIVVVVLNPFCATQQGFWLSFCAVFALLLGLSYRVEPGRWWQKMLQMQLVLTVGLSGILCVFGVPLSGVSFVANLFAVPLIGVFIVPCIFLAAVLSSFSMVLAQLMFQCADMALLKLWDGLVYLSDIEALFWFSPGAPIPTISIILGTLLLIVSARLRLQGPAVVLIVASLASQSGNDRVRLSVLDVGQGLAVVFESPNETLVYDTGARFSDRFDIGSRVLAPYLRYRNIRHVDFLVVSHGDNDHAGGLVGLVQSMDIGTVISNHVSPSEISDSTLWTCHNDRKWQMGEVTAQVLWPAISNIEQYSSNNQSCVILLEWQGYSVLMAGDIESEVEMALLASGVLPDRVDVLVAPHHGSATSSSMAFLKAVNPKHVIYSAGYRNRYRHPAKRVIKRYEIIGAEQWHTGTHGALTFEWNDLAVLCVNAERLNKQKAWYAFDGRSWP